MQAATPAYLKSLGKKLGGCTGEAICLRTHQRKRVIPLYLVGGQQEGASDYSEV